MPNTSNILIFLICFCFWDSFTVLLVIVNILIDKVLIHKELRLGKSCFCLLLPSNRFENNHGYSISFKWSFQGVYFICLHFKILEISFFAFRVHTHCRKANEKAMGFSDIIRWLNKVHFHIIDTVFWEADLKVH